MLDRHDISLRKLLAYVGLSQSSYFYKPQANARKGRRPDLLTWHNERGWLTETDVLESIRKLLGHEFIDCGYQIMTCYLKREGYRINHKKVYRIMRTAGLLKPNLRIRAKGGGRKFVQFRKVITTHPMECLEMDIKLVWLPDRRKNAYLLSVIDVHTRKILDYTLSMSIKKKEVIELLGKIFMQYPTAQSMIIRSDNGSQFIAHKVREYISSQGFDQEFTHVATPEENAHIEAYHGTLKRDLIERFEYRHFGGFESILKRYVKFYNTFRVHGMLGKITPQQKWDQDIHLLFEKYPEEQKNVA